ncbi:SMR family transporter [Halomonas sp. 328]|uniref:SMR family transporter n=1 Tax=Halomonas sp. 328 TaxID=2776704 RepID=UPI0018A77D7C|nr:SMR family transporter [Halomonas sp. 328]MBF8223975.1 QacE family quaternary ammonium compound efflux SMR transporter [Halomonas sp. 328]
MRLAWMFLLLAILTEVSGVSTMNLLSQGEGITGYLIMYACIALSYLFLGFAVKKIAVGVAFAMWEGLGIALITAISLLVFDSVLSTQELIGLGLVVVGIVMINAGESHAPATTRETTS